MPLGVNDYGTTVGYSQANSQAFVRHTDGTVSWFQAPNAQKTVFRSRNNAGVTAGGYTLASQTSPVPGSGLIRNGSQSTPVNYPGATVTELYGINKYNTTVGIATDSNFQTHGFRRYSSGSFQTLQYPGAQDTWPRGINNHGTIVGTAAGHGFIYHAGTWAKVVYSQSPNVNGTQVFGISNNNVIVGQAGSSPPTSFLYANGVFKIILAPNSSNTQVQGISGSGLITGIAFINGVNAGQGFLATCQ